MNNCEALGWYAAHNKQGSVILVDSKGAWSEEVAPRPDPKSKGEELNAMSCSPAGSCIFAGDWADKLEWSDNKIHVHGYIVQGAPGKRRVVQLPATAAVKPQFLDLSAADCYGGVC